MAQPLLCFYLNFLIFQTCRYFWTLLDLAEPVFDPLQRPQGAHFIHHSCKLIMLTNEGWNHIKGCAHTSEITWAERLFSYENRVSASEKAWGETCKRAEDTSHCFPYSLRQWRSNGNAAALGTPQRVPFLYLAASGSIVSVDGLLSVSLLLFPFMPDHSIYLKMLSNPPHLVTHNPALVMGELHWSLYPCGQAKVTKLKQICHIYVYPAFGTCAYSLRATP